MHGRPDSLDYWSTEWLTFDESILNELRLLIIKDMDISVHRYAGKVSGRYVRPRGPIVVTGDVSHIEYI